MHKLNGLVTMPFNIDAKPFIWFISRPPRLMLILTIRPSGEDPRRTAVGGDALAVPCGTGVIPMAWSAGRAEDGI